MRFLLWLRPRADTAAWTCVQNASECIAACYGRDIYSLDRDADTNLPHNLTLQFRSGLANVRVLARLLPPLFSVLAPLSSPILKDPVRHPFFKCLQVELRSNLPSQPCPGLFSGSPLHSSQAGLAI